MDRGVAVVMTACAGGLVALQAPINHLLGGRVGTFGAATISFLTGTLLLLVITALTGGVKLAGHGSLPWYYFLGGVLGIAYVTTVLVTVGPLGAGGVTAATITGQLVTAVVIDRLGILGLTQKPLSAPRVAGVVLLAAGVYLIVRD
ncbi:MAG: DMT family transporter [Thermoleophilaceae bacterium]